MARTKQRTRIQDFIVTSGDEVRGEDGVSPGAILVRGGEDSASADGADAEFRGGDGLSGSSGGGNGTFRAGDAGSAGGIGGDLLVRAGDSPNGLGATAVFRAGDGLMGGFADLRAGDGVTADGGDMSVSAGAGATVGGSLALAAGDGPAGGGSASLLAGNGSGGGNITVSAGTGVSLGGTVTISAGDDTGTSGDAGTIFLTPGSATNGAGLGDGGSLVLSVGLASGSGSNGSLIFDYATWPAADGSSGQVLTTDGAGNLNWGAGGGGGTCSHGGYRTGNAQIFPTGQNISAGSFIPVTQPTEAFPDLVDFTHSNPNEIEYTGATTKTFYVEAKLTVAAAPTQTLGDNFRIGLEIAGSAPSFPGEVHQHWLSPGDGVNPGDRIEITINFQIELSTNDTVRISVSTESVSSFDLAIYQTTLTIWECASGGGGGGGEDLAATLVIGNTTSGTDLEVSSGDAIQLANTGGSIDDSSGTVVVSSSTSPLTLDTSAGAGDITLDPGGGLILDYATWPPADGTGGQVLTTNGAGTLSWTTPGGGVSDLQGAYDGGNTIVTSPTSGDLDVSGTEAISLDSLSASNFTVDSADLVLSTTTSGELDLTSAGLMDVNAGAGLDIDVTGTFDMLSTGAFSIDGGAGSNVSTTGADLTLSTLTTGDVLVTAADDIRLTPGASGFIGIDGLTDRDGTGFKFGSASVPVAATSVSITFIPPFPVGPPALVITVTIEDTTAVPPGTPPPSYWVHSAGPGGFTVQFATGSPTTTHVIHWTARH